MRWTACNPVPSPVGIYQHMLVVCILFTGGMLKAKRPAGGLHWSLAGKQDSPSWDRLQRHMLDIEEWKSTAYNSLNVGDNLVHILSFTTWLFLHRIKAMVKFIFPKQAFHIKGIHFPKRQVHIPWMSLLMNHCSWVSQLKGRGYFKFNKIGTGTRHHSWI